MSNNTNNTNNNTTVRPNPFIMEPTPYIVNQSNIPMKILSPGNNRIFNALNTKHEWISLLNFFSQKFNETSEIIPTNLNKSDSVNENLFEHNELSHIQVPSLDNLEINHIDKLKKHNIDVKKHIIHLTITINQAEDFIVNEFKKYSDTPEICRDRDRERTIVDGVRVSIDEKTANISLNEFKDKLIEIGCDKPSQNKCNKNTPCDEKKCEAEPLGKGMKGSLLTCQSIYMLLVMFICNYLNIKEQPPNMYMIKPFGKSSFHIDTKNKTFSQRRVYYLISDTTTYDDIDIPKFNKLYSIMQQINYKDDKVTFVIVPLPIVENDIIEILKKVYPVKNMVEGGGIKKKSKSISKSKRHRKTSRKHKKSKSKVRKHKSKRRL